MNSFLSRKELDTIGFGSIGNDVNISRHCSIYSPNNIHIGNHVRVDDFCILSGNVSIGNYVHIAAGVYLFAGESRIILEDFSGISSQSSVYAVSDDYVGGYLTNPMIPAKYRNIIVGEVVIGKHVVIGTHSVILPAVRIGCGSSIGAMSLVVKDVEAWGVYVGIPCRKIKDRERIGIIQKEKTLMSL